MSTHYYAACDLGAESGRVMLGALKGERLELEEVHRFPNGPVNICGTMRWDVLRIFEELKVGLRKIGARGVAVDSVSTDSWGVDYVLLHGTEPMLTAPYHYRDARTDSGFERAFAVVPAEEIFAETGIQFMTLNTLYQLLDDLDHRRAVLELCEQFLLIGDYFNYLLSGARKAEESLASTTQLYNPQQRNWSEKLIRAFGLPRRIFPEVVPSGTRLGVLLQEIAAETDLRGTQVVASCSHDTGAAVAAVPAEGQGWAYLSSGTWSLLGVESAKPIITTKSREFNFTNEIGYGGTIRFLKNIIGLWIVQECRRAWAKAGREYTYEQLVQMADAAEPLKCLIHPAAPRFVKPDDMPQKISDYCRRTNQPIPDTPGETVRCALESLALLYRQRLDELALITGWCPTRLHIVGGGSKNTLLNQLSADATQLPVYAGPVEATAIGNILIQAITLGHLPSLAALRQTVRNSFPITIYRPRDAAAWETAYQRFQELDPHL